MNPHPEPIVKERPILFSGPMVRALLAGAKTQTRRLVKPQPTEADWDRCRANLGGDTHKAYPWVHPAFGLGLRRDALLPDAGVGFPDPNIPCPYGRPGERLWVRETCFDNDNGGEWIYRADGDFDEQFEMVEGDPKWTPSIHCPRRASRILLEITDVRVERLQAISEADAVAEGCDDTRDMDPRPGRIFYAGGPRAAYAVLWDDINGAGAWDANPWVWCLTFKRVTP